MSKEKTVEKGKESEGEQERLRGKEVGSHRRERERGPWVLPPFFILKSCVQAVSNKLLNLIKQSVLYYKAQKALRLLLL